MEPKKSWQREEEEFRKLREQLRALPRLQAPWYFDAQLQQHLPKGGKRSAGRLTPPLVAGIVMFVCIAGAIGYLLPLLTENRPGENRTQSPSIPQLETTQQAPPGVLAPVQHPPVRPVETRSKSREGDTVRLARNDSRRPTTLLQDTTSPARQRLSSGIDSSVRVPDTSVSTPIRMRDGQSRDTNIVLPDSTKRLRIDSNVR